MSALFDALLSAQYHATKTMALADAKGGRPPLLPGAGSWLERVTRREGRASRFLRPLASVDEAVRVIRDHPDPAKDHLALRCATGALAAAHYVAKKETLETFRPAVEKMLAGLLKGGTNDLLRAGDAWEAFAHGARDDASGRLPPFSPDFRLKVNCATMDESEVTIFDAQVESDASKTTTIADVAKAADPRSWCKTFPELFAQTYLIEDPTRCTDRYSDPEEFNDGVPAEKGYRGYLFEHATLGMIGSFRNILKLDLSSQSSGDGRQGHVDIIYSLHEPLSNTVLGVPRPGGFDVDSADPERHPCKITLEEGKMTTRASKKMRFSQYTEFSDELNLVTLPLLNVWVTGLLVGSVYVTK